jgi:hypothetical protein
MLSRFGLGVILFSCCVQTAGSIVNWVDIIMIMPARRWISRRSSHIVLRSFYWRITN